MVEWFHSTSNRAKISRVKEYVAHIGGIWRLGSIDRVGRHNPESRMSLHGRQICQGRQGMPLDMLWLAPDVDVSAVNDSLFPGELLALCNM